MFDYALNWAFGAISTALEFVYEKFIGFLGLDTDIFTSYFPIAGNLYGIFQGVAFGFVLGLAGFQLLTYLSGIGLDRAESPIRIGVRVVAASALILFGNYILDFLVDLFKLPYNFIQQAENYDVETSALVSGLQDEVSSSVTGSGSGSASAAGIFILVILLAFFLYKFVAFALEVVERYLVVCVMIFTSPLAWATASSSNTSNVLKKWSQMFITQCLMILFNVWSFQMLFSLLSSTTVPSQLMRFVLALGILEVARRIDSYISSLGVSVAHTGGNLMGEIVTSFGAIRGAAEAVKGGVAGAYNFGRAVKGEEVRNMGPITGFAAGLASSAFNSSARNINAATSSSGGEGGTGRYSSRLQSMAMGVPMNNTGRVILDRSGQAVIGIDQKAKNKGIKLSSKGMAGDRAATLTSSSPARLVSFMQDAAARRSTSVGEQEFLAHNIMKSGVHRAMMASTLGVFGATTNASVQASMVGRGKQFTESMQDVQNGNQPVGGDMMNGLSSMQRAINEASMPGAKFDENGVFHASDGSTISNLMSGNGSSCGTYTPMIDGKLGQSTDYEFGIDSANMLSSNDMGPGVAKLSFIDSKNERTFLTLSNKDALTSAPVGKDAASSFRARAWDVKDSLKPESDNLSQHYNPYVAEELTQCIDNIAQGRGAAATAAGSFITATAIAESGDMSGEFHMLDNGEDVSVPFTLSSQQTPGSARYETADGDIKFITMDQSRFNLAVSNDEFDGDKFMAPEKSLRNLAYDFSNDRDQRVIEARWKEFGTPDLSIAFADIPEERQAEILEDPDFLELYESGINSDSIVGEWTKENCYDRLRNAALSGNLQNSPRLSSLVEKLSKGNITYNFDNGNTDHYMEWASRNKAKHKR